MKSHEIASLVEFLVCLVRDLEEECSTVASKDISRIKERILHEGLSFLTITLPAFLDEFNLALEQGRITSSQFTGWSKWRCLPAFLRGFTSLVFDAETGGLLDEPKIEAVHSVRQICLVYKKVKLECIDRRKIAAIEKYTRTDDEIGALFSRISNSDIATYRQVSRLVVSSLFPRAVSSELICKHGPGATAEKISGNKKYSFRCTWPLRLCASFGPEHLFNSEESYFRSGIEIDCLEEEFEVPARIALVPKTQKTPRIIAMEPVAMQMAQQAVKGFLVDELERAPLTRGHINFSDQSINRCLAQQASINREMATVDLSEASDRVHNELVKILFEVNPSISDLLQNTRSTKSILPDGTSKTLQKFASMGSAVCFPVEALHFFVLCLIGRLQHNNLPITLKNIYLMSRDVYVYGDDIIVPADEVEAVYHALEVYGCVVNSSKSFFRGYFRESCGLDAYMGVDITPVYVRHTFPDSRTESAALISLTAAANQFYEHGYLRAFGYLKKVVEKCLGELPEVASTCSGLGWLSPDSSSKSRFNKRLQRREVLTFVPTPIFQKDRIGGYAALAKCLLMLELGSVRESHCPYTVKVKDEQHLGRSPRHGAVTLKRRWVSPQ